MDTRTQLARQTAATVDILGVPVSRITLASAVAHILDTIRRGFAQYICVRDVHGLMRAVDDPRMMDIQRDAGLVTPDGMPLVWAAKARGYDDIARVCGADLMEALFEATRGEDMPHYFFGGREGVAERLADAMQERFPGVKIAGWHCPPFRPLTDTENAEVIAEIRASGARIVWMGISTPKQEYWMSENVAKLPGVTLIGVGAAFDFHTGEVRRAPRWMQKRGLEWAHRLGSEPRRLWRRYLILAPRFVVAVARDWGRMRQTDKAR